MTMISGKYLEGPELHYILKAALCLMGHGRAGEVGLPLPMTLPRCTNSSITAGALLNDPSLPFLEKRLQEPRGLLCHPSQPAKKLQPRETFAPCEAAVQRRWPPSSWTRATNRARQEIGTYLPHCQCSGAAKQSAHPDGFPRCQAGRCSRA